MASQFLLAVKLKDRATVEKLLKEGADVNESTEDGVTALMSAVMNNDYKMVRALLEHNPDLNATRKDHERGGGPTAIRNFTALDYAEYFEHDTIIALLRIRGARTASDLAA